MTNDSVLPEHADSGSFAHLGHGAHGGRHRTRVQYLLAGDETVLAEIQALAATLPLCATGRIFVEVASEADVFELSAPPRMTVTWLARSARRGSVGSGRACARGEAVSRAARAWASEMLCDDPESAHIWLGGDERGVAETYRHLTVGLDILPDHIHGAARA